MNLCLSRNEIHQSERIYFRKILEYRYPCDIFESGTKSSFIVKIKEQPTAIEINNHQHEEYLPFGTYHLQRVFCTCSHVDKISRKIKWLFRIKITQPTNCRVHNKEFDVYLRSNQPISFKKI